MKRKRGEWPKGIMNIIIIEHSGDQRIFFYIFRNITISEMLPEGFIEKFLNLDQLELTASMV